VFVIGYAHSRVDVDARLDGLPSGDADVVSLQVGAVNALLLRQCWLEHKGACESQCCSGDDSSRFHGKSLRHCVLAGDVLLVMNRQLKRGGGTAALLERRPSAGFQ
jgi:hypothetical protein